MTLNPHPTEISEKILPLTPDSITDLAWGLCLYFSDKDQERKFGEDVKAKWDGLVQKYQKDPAASRFLDNVNATMAGTAYTLARIRHGVDEQFAFLDELQNRHIRDLDDLASLSKDAQSIAARVAGLTMGGGVTFLAFASSLLAPIQTVYVVVGAGVAYFLLEMALRLYRKCRAPRIIEQTQRDKEAVLRNQFEPKSQEILFGFLEKINAIAKKIYASEMIEQSRLAEVTSGSAYAQGRAFLTGSSLPSVAIYGTFLDSDNKPLGVYGSVSASGTIIDPQSGQPTGTKVQVGGILRPSGQYSLGVQPGTYDVFVRPTGYPETQIASAMTVLHESVKLDRRLTPPSKTT